MAKRRHEPPEVRERISDTLERVTMPDGHFTHKFVYSESLVVWCPRCRRLVAIASVTIWLRLSCGCEWHPPRDSDDGGGQSWTSYSREEATT